MISTVCVCAKDVIIHYIGFYVTLQHFTVLYSATSAFTNLSNHTGCGSEEVGSNLDEPPLFWQTILQSDINCIGRWACFSVVKITAISSEKLFGMLARCYD